MSDTAPGRVRAGTPILDRLAAGPVLGDGGYLLELEKRGYVQAGPFTPEVVLDHPEALEGLHREFVRAGAEVIQTMTFYASEDKLATVGLSGRVEAINRQAVEIARKVAGEGDTLVAGNLCLTWAYQPGDPSSADRVRHLFDAQIETQLDAGGVDFWIGETFSYLGEALLFVERAKRTGLPVMATMSFEALPAAAYEGDGPAECARRLVDAGADIVGTNCLNDPELQLPWAVEMRAAVDVPIACQPAGFRTSPCQPDFTGRPEFPYGLDPLQLSRQEMARFAEDAAAAGIGYIGSCCGTAAGHVRAMAKALGKRPVEERPWRSTTGRAMSAYEWHGHEETETG